MKTLKGRIAVVTGAASGIGRATAVALADEGCDLALVDVNETGLKETAAAIRRINRRATTHVVDVSDANAMQALVDDVIAEHGSVNIVMNNAGVGVGSNLEDHSLEDFEWLMGINFWGVVYGTKFFLPHLKRADEACVVNISSMFGLIGLPSQSAYCASKFAVRGFSEAVAAEVAEDGIDVVCVHPGGIRTDIAKTSRLTGPNTEALRAKTVRFFETKAMPAEDAAAKIIRGIKRGSRRVLITKETYVTDVFKRVLPTSNPKMVAKARRWLGLS